MKTDAETTTWLIHHLVMMLVSGQHSQTLNCRRALRGNSLLLWGDSNMVFHDSLIAYS